MNVVQRLERWLEERIEGLFRRGVQGGVQPVEIGRRMVREMEGQRRVSVNRVYVPNEYAVTLSTPDFESLRAFGGELSAELARHLAARAERQGYVVPGHLVIRFDLDPALEVGRFTVTTAFAAQPAGGEQEPPARDEDTMVFRLQRSRDVSGTEPAETVARGEEPELGVRLEATTGPQAGRVIPLTHGEVTLGRGEDNPVVLNDPNVSRVHASLVVQGGQLTVHDLGSRNGTWVNGQRVDETELKEGDELRIGMTVLRVRGT